MVRAQLLSCVRIFATHQAPLDHGIPQLRIQEQVAFPFSRNSP